MFHLIKLSDFLREGSYSPRLKLDLAGLSFAGLVVPTALLISIGAPEEYALPLMMIAILPFQYILVCILRMRRDGRLEENRPMVGPPLIRSSLREKTEIKVERFTHYEEHYFWFLWPALFILIMEIIWTDLIFVKIP